MSLVVDRIGELGQAIQQKATELVIQVRAKTDPDATFKSIRKALENSKGDCDVFIEIVLDESLVRVRAHPSLKVEGSSDLETALQKLGCQIKWGGFDVTPRAAAAGTA